MTPEEYQQHLIEKILNLEELEISLRAKRGLEDLYFFNREILERENPERQKNIVPHVHGEWWEWFKTGEHRNKLILVPRHSLKTTFFTVGLTLQLIANDRNVRILLANAKLGNAKKFLDEIKNHLRTNAALHECYGEFYDKELTWTTEEVRVTGRSSTVREPTITAIGVGGGLASMHYDWIIGDDLMNEINSANKEQAEKVIDWWRRAFSLLAKKTGRSLVIGTRWADFDVYNHIIENHSDTTDVLIRTAFNPDGSCYYPEMLDKKELARLRDLEGGRYFSAFYYNDPIDPETSLIRPEHIHYYDQECPCGEFHRLPERGEMTVFIGIDPAFSTSTQADEAAIVAVGMTKENTHFVLEAQSGRWGSEVLLERIFELHNTLSKDSPVEGVSIEVLSMSSAFVSQINEMEIIQKVFLPLKQITSRPPKRKAARLEAMLAPKFARGSVFISSEMHSLEEQLIRYPRSKYDDLLDALADAIELSYPPTIEVVQRYRPATVEEKINAQLERRREGRIFVDDVLGEYY